VNSETSVFYAKAVELPITVGVTSYNNEQFHTMPYAKPHKRGKNYSSKTKQLLGRNVGFYQFISALFLREHP